MVSIISDFPTYCIIVSKLFVLLYYLSFCIIVLSIQAIYFDSI